jgi:hypothetical protein
MGDNLVGASTAALRDSYPALARRLQILWWWGRVRRAGRTVGRAVVFGLAVAFAVLSCSRAYSHLVTGLGSLRQP